jgi:hypothetical protein
MQFTIVIQDEVVNIYDSRTGGHATFIGRKATEVDAIKQIKKLIIESNNSKEISNVILTADMKGEALKKLRPQKLVMSKSSKDKK